MLNVKQQGVGLGDLQDDSTGSSTQKEKKYKHRSIIRLERKENWKNKRWKLTELWYCAMVELQDLEADHVVDLHVIEQLLYGLDTATDSKSTRTDQHNRCRMTRPAAALEIVERQIDTTPRRRHDE